MAFLFLTDQLEELEFQKAHECGNTSYAYIFLHKSNVTSDIFGIFVSFSLSNVSSHSIFSHCLLFWVLL